MSLKVSVSGSDVVGWGTDLDPFDVEFEGNEPADILDPSGLGWTVTGSAPARVLRSPSGDVFASEVPDPTLTEGAAAFGGGGGGGSQPVTDTATLTTDADTFLATHTFDLGRIAAVYLNQTVTALVGDGETWGQGEGEIAVGGGSANVRVSRDGSTWYVLNEVPGVFLLSNSEMTAVTHHRDAVLIVPRYLRVNLQIDDYTAGEMYAGANHPTATVRIDVEAAT